MAMATTTDAKQISVRKTYFGSGELNKANFKHIDVNFGNRMEIQCSSVNSADSCNVPNFKQ